MLGNSKIIGLIDFLFGVLEINLGLLSVCVQELEIRLSLLPKTTCKKSKSVTLILEDGSLEVAVLYIYIISHKAL